MSKTRDLYKIGDLTKKLKITPRTIRYYDQLGLLPNIKRSDGDTRIFDNIDIALIEKTRYYQKTNFLPLFEIKSKLFPTALNKYKLVFITESEYKKKYLLPDTVEVINIKSTTQQNILKELTKIEEKESKEVIFIYFYDPKKNKFYLELSKNKKIHIKVYPLVDHGFTSYLLINHLTNIFNTDSSLEELDLLISQFIDLSFSIGILDTITNFFPDQAPSKIINTSLSLFHPIFTSTALNFEIKHFCLDNHELYTKFIDEFEIELLKRKRYITNVEIFSYNSSNHAKEIKKKLEKKFNKLKIKINTISKWPFNGTKGITLTLI